MSQLISPPEPAVVGRLSPLGNRPAPTEPRSTPLGTFWRGAVVMALAAVAVAWLTLGLMPAFFAALLLLLPALAPLVVVGLGVLIEDARRCHEAGPPACMCHRDRR